MHGKRNIEQNFFRSIDATGNFVKLFRFCSTLKMALTFPPVLRETNLLSFFFCGSTEGDGSQCGNGGFVETGKVSCSAVKLSMTKKRSWAKDFRRRTGLR